MEMERDWNGGTHVGSSSSIITETEISSDQVKILLQACRQILNIHFFYPDQAKAGSPPSNGDPNCNYSMT